MERVKKQRDLAEVSLSVYTLCTSIAPSLTRRHVVVVNRYLYSKPLIETLYRTRLLRGPSRLSRERVIKASCGDGSLAGSLPRPPVLLGHQPPLLLLREVEL